MGAVLFDEVQAAQHHELVHDAGLLRHQLAALHAGHVAADRLELAAKFDRGARLHVVHVQMRRAAVQEDHDYAFARRGARRGHGLTP